MHKFFGYILSPIHYVIYGFFLLLFQPIQWCSLKFGGYLTHKKSVDVLNFFLVSTYYLLFNRITFVNKQSLPNDRPIIFVANHQSMYDIPPLIWFLRKHHGKFISKIELTKGILSISFNLKYGGGANIDRNNTKQSIIEIMGFAKRMSENCWSAFIFPEGTRSKDGHLKPFAAGGINALLKKVPEALIVPIVIKNSWKMVRFGKFPLSAGEHLKFKVLEPIEPTGKSVEQLIGIIETAIGTNLA